MSNRPKFTPDADAAPFERSRERRATVGVYARRDAESGAARRAARSKARKGWTR